MRGRTLGSYLWKEWRDQRAVLVGVVLAVPLLLVVMGLSLPRRAFDLEGFAGIASVACLALFVVSLAADLVPGEARRGHRRFLERIPGGLGAAFRGKLLFFAGGGALFALYGYSAGVVTCRVVTGVWPPVILGSTLTCAVAIVALWTFAVSCSLPRGALSLPAVAALALLLALPLAGIWRFDPWGGLETWERWESAALWGAGAIVAAWVAFRRSGLLRAGGACVAVGAVCAVPYWGDAAREAYLWTFDSEVAIRDGFLGEGGRYAFLTRVREGRPWGLHDWNRREKALPPMIVDLRSGVAREVAGQWWSPRAPSAYGMPQRYVVLTRAKSPTIRESEIYDARTAEPAEPGRGDLRAARRAATPWRLPDGRRFWWIDGRLEAGGESGGTEVLAEGWREQCQPCGLGVGFESLFDPARGRVYERAALKLPGYQMAWIRPGRWLLGSSPVPVLFDPDTTRREPAVMQAGDSIGAVLDDGRLVVNRDERSLLVDPETGAASEIPLAPRTSVKEPYYRSLVRTPDGRRVLGVWDRRGGAIARLEPATSAFVLTARVAPYAMLLGCPADDEAIVRTRDALYRLRFGSDEREEIWRAR